MNMKQTIFAVYVSDIPVTLKQTTLKLLRK